MLRADCTELGKAGLWLSNRCAPRASSRGCLRTAQHMEPLQHLGSADRRLNAPLLKNESRGVDLGGEFRTSLQSQWPQQAAKAKVIKMRSSARRSWTFFTHAAHARYRLLPVGILTSTSLHVRGLGAVLQDLGRLPQISPTRPTLKATLYTVMMSAM